MSSSKNTTRMTRRQWTALLGAAAPLTAAQVTTSRVPPEGSPQPAPPSSAPQEKLKKANDDVHRVSDRLTSIQVPMDVEPAFSFKA